MKRGIERLLPVVAGMALCGFAATLSYSQEAQPLGDVAGATLADRCNANYISDAFVDDPKTRVRLVKAFSKGEPLTLGGQSDAQQAPNDLCVVKLMVGPGNPGPTGAPSTSEGIGIEIWLPAAENWSGRIHNLGSGGLDGVSEVSSLTKLGAFASLYMGGPAMMAGLTGAVSAIHDSGHVSEGPMGVGHVSFLMNPDGTINEALGRDFAGRAGHEMAVKTKQLVHHLYGKRENYAYFVGCSNGGRQGMKAAQDYPEDYDGILAGAPAISVTHMAQTGFYPSIVFQQDLGGKAIAPEQLELVSAAAVSACDTDVTGQHVGYISNPAICRYNPAKDTDVLCTSDGGKNDTPQCVTRLQAKAINKIWYGPTSDGSVPDPAASNGFSMKLERKHVWYGPARGTRLAASSPAELMMTIASSKDGEIIPFPMAPHVAAVFLGDPSLATPDFQNATGNGENGWKALGYRDLARIAARGLALQGKLGHMNADNPNLAAFKARGGKLLSYHGTADQVIPIQGTDRYYEAVARKLGGFEAVKSFYRYYQVPAYGHCFGVGQVDGLPGVSPKADPPLPGYTQFFEQLVAWVEQGKAPEDIVLTSTSGKSSRPICTYPKQVRYTGGNIDDASSYVCELPR